MRRDRALTPGAPVTCRFIRPPPKSAFESDAKLALARHLVTRKKTPEIHNLLLSIRCKESEFLGNPADHPIRRLARPIIVIDHEMIPFFRLGKGGPEADQAAIP